MRNALWGYGEMQLIPLDSIRPVAESATPRLSARILAEFPAFLGWSGSCVALGHGGDRKAICLCASKPLRSGAPLRGPHQRRGRTPPPAQQRPSWAHRQAPALVSSGHGRVQGRAHSILFRALSQDRLRPSFRQAPLRATHYSSVNPPNVGVISSNPANRGLISSNPANRGLISPNPANRGLISPKPAKRAKADNFLPPSSVYIRR